MKPSAAIIQRLEELRDGPLPDASWWQWDRALTGDPEVWQLDHEGKEYYFASKPEPGMTHTPLIAGVDDPQAALYCVLRALSDTTPKSAVEPLTPEQKRAQLMAEVKRLQLTLDRLKAETEAAGEKLKALWARFDDLGRVAE